MHSESKKLWSALEAVANREPADVTTVAKLATLGLVRFDDARPVVTPRGEAALVVLESGDGEVPELDGA